jgi:uncharacterized membrane protein
VIKPPEPGARASSTNTVAGPRGPRLAGTWLLLAIVLLATALRVYKLGSLPVEQDEMYTLRDALRFGEQVNYLRPFYYFLQSLLLEVFPPTPLALRLMPFVFGLAGVWFTWELGRRVFGVTGGLVAAFLVTISAWHLYASQFARYWTLVYALAALFYVALLHAVDTDRPRAFLLTLATVLVGTLTHPTYVFPLVGVILAVQLVSKDGQIRWTWPSRSAWLYLWGPLTIIGLAGFLFLLASGSLTGLRGSRGLSAAVRLVPAMVQWASPAVVAAAGVGMLYQLLSKSDTDRRWGAVASLGCATAVGLLLLASLRKSVFADYAMAALPLIYVSAGGAIQRVAERLGSGARVFVAGAVLTLAAAVLPGTVSHMIDGTRFDYRGAYRYVERVGGDQLVVAWPEAVKRFYAPELPFKPLRRDTTFLGATLQETSGFWLVASYRRYGMVLDDGSTERWINTYCRPILRTERQRLDYRIYRVVLHWCGPGPAPSA